MTDTERAALRAAASKNKPETYIWDGKDGSLQAMYATPEGWAAVLALLARLERVEGALEQITQSHIPDQPAAYGMDDLAWAQRHVGTLRAIARAALEHGA